MSREKKTKAFEKRLNRRIERNTNHLPWDYRLKDMGIVQLLWELSKEGYSTDEFDDFSKKELIKHLKDNRT